MQAPWGKPSNILQVKPENRTSRSHGKGKFPTRSREKPMKKLFGYLKAYNFIRLYQALNLKTPAEEFKRAILEVVRVFTMY
jgi:hypothetical protein